MKIELSKTLFFFISRILCGKPNQTKSELFYHCATIKITEVLCLSIIDANSHLLTHICAGVSIQTRLKIAEKWSKILENVSKTLWPTEKKTFTNYRATSSCVGSLKRWKPNQHMKELKLSRFWFAKEQLRNIRIGCSRSVNFRMHLWSHCFSLNMSEKLTEILTIFVHILGENLTSLIHSEI